MSLSDDTGTRALIDRALRNVLWNASSYPVRVQSRILGSDMSGLIGRATDAVLAVLSQQVPDQPREDEHALSGLCILDGCHQHAMPGPATVPAVSGASAATAAVVGREGKYGHCSECAFSAGHAARCSMGREAEPLAVSTPDRGDQR